MRDCIFKGFVLPFKVWLWSFSSKTNRWEDTENYVNNNKKISLLYTSLIWTCSGLLILLTSITPSYLMTAGLLLLVWVVSNTIYKISERQGDIFTSLFWFSIFVGIFIFLSIN